MCLDITHRPNLAKGRSASLADGKDRQVPPTRRCPALLSYLLQLLLNLARFPPDCIKYPLSPSQDFVFFLQSSLIESIADLPYFLPHCLVC